MQQAQRTSERCWSIKNWKVYLWGLPSLGTENVLDRTFQVTLIISPSILKMHIFQYKTNSFLRQLFNEMSLKLVAKSMEIRRNIVCLPCYFGYHRAGWYRVAYRAKFLVHLSVRSLLAVIPAIKDDLGGVKNADEWIGVICIIFLHGRTVGQTNTVSDPILLDRRSNGQCIRLGRQLRWKPCFPSNPFCIPPSSHCMPFAL